MLLFVPEKALISFCIKSLWNSDLVVKVTVMLSFVWVGESFYKEEESVEGFNLEKNILHVM